MNVAFTASDLARCEAASRALLSPLAAPSVNAWRRDVNRAIRELFHGDAVLFMMPGTDRLVYSDDAQDVAVDFSSYISITPEGQMAVADPVLQPWAALRRRDGVEVFDRRTNAEMVLRTGHHPLESPLIHEVLLDNRLTDYEGLFTSVGSGETILWVLHERPGGSPFGEHSVDVFRALLPSFKTGLDMLNRLHLHRAALDVVDEPLIVFDVNGRELFRNGPLKRLLAAASDPDALVGAVRQAADDARHRLLPSRRVPAGLFTPATRMVHTPTAQYQVRATVVEAGVFQAGESVVALVQEQARPLRIDAAILRERFDLTRREAEIAVLIGDGLSNPDIANRLFISVHTVKRHVEKILVKLEVPSRAAVHAKLLQASWGVPA